MKTTNIDSEKMVTPVSSVSNMSWLNSPMIIMNTERAETPKYWKGRVSENGSLSSSRTPLPPSSRSSSLPLSDEENAREHEDHDDHDQGKLFEVVHDGTQRKDEGGQFDVQHFNRAEDLFSIERKKQRKRRRNIMVEKICSCNSKSRIVDVTAGVLNE